MKQYAQSVPLRSLIPSLDNDGYTRLSANDKCMLFIWDGEEYEAYDNQPLVWSDYGQQWDVMLCMAPYESTWHLGCYVNDSSQPYCEVLFTGTRAQALVAYCDDSFHFRAAEAGMYELSKEELNEIQSETDRDVWNQVAFLVPLVVV